MLGQCIYVENSSKSNFEMENITPYNSVQMRIRHQVFEINAQVTHLKGAISHHLSKKSPYRYSLKMQVERTFANLLIISQYMFACHGWWFAPFQFALLQWHGPHLETAR